MSGYIDYSGQVFSRLTVIEPLYKKKNRFSAIWICRCSCGKEARVRISNVTRGRTKSCGCLQLESVTTHGNSQRVEYAAWLAMVYRCHNPEHPHYCDYGARGITVCDEWKGDFETFYRVMGPRPSDEYSIDRKDNDKGYTKENCHWVTSAEQNRNKRGNRVYEFNGRKNVLMDWCKEFNIDHANVYQRIRRGWSFEQAMFGK